MQFLPSLDKAAFGGEQVARRRRLQHAIARRAPSRIDILAAERFVPIAIFIYSLQFKELACDHPLLGGMTPEAPFQACCRLALVRRDGAYRMIGRTSWPGSQQHARYNSEFRRLTGLARLGGNAVGLRAVKSTSTSPLMLERANVEDAIRTCAEKGDLEAFRAYSTARSAASGGHPVAGHKSQKPLHEGGPEVGYI